MPAGTSEKKTKQRESRKNVKPKVGRRLWEKPRKRPPQKGSGGPQAPSKNRPAQSDSGLGDSFKERFKKEREKGNYSFWWKGTEITTRHKGESVAEHKKKFK